MAVLKTTGAVLHKSAKVITTAAELFSNELDALKVSRVADHAETVADAFDRISKATDGKIDAKESTTTIVLEMLGKQTQN